MFIGMKSFYRYEIFSLNTFEEFWILQSTIIKFYWDLPPYTVEKTAKNKLNFIWQWN